MFLGAFKSSLHIIEFNWAAADERVGGELGEEPGEGRADRHTSGSRCLAWPLSEGPEELCPGREWPRRSLGIARSSLKPTAGHPAPAACMPRERRPTAGRTAGVLLQAHCKTLCCNAELVKPVCAQPPPCARKED